MATVTSQQSGNWTTGGTWVGGSAPQTGDTAVIAAGHIVTVDTTGIQITNVDIYGRLKWSRAATSSLEILSGAASYIRSTGVIDMGIVGDIIPKEVTATLIGRGLWTFADGAQIYSHGDYLYNGALNTSKGMRRIASLLAANANAGQNQIVLQEDLGFRTGGGDTITISGNRYEGYRYLRAQEVTVSAYNPATKTVTLNTNLAYNKIGGECWVTCAYQRNVIITGATGTNTFRFHSPGAFPNSYVVFIETSFGGYTAQNYGLFYSFTGNIDRQHFKFRSCWFSPTGSSTFVICQQVSNLTVEGCAAGITGGYALQSLFYSTVDYCCVIGSNGWAGWMVHGSVNCDFSDQIYASCLQLNFAGNGALVRDSIFWDTEYIQPAIGAEDVTWLRCVFGKNIYFMSDCVNQTLESCSFDQADGVGSWLRSVNVKVRNPTYAPDGSFDLFDTLNMQLNRINLYTCRLADSTVNQKFGHTSCQGIVVTASSPGIPSGLFTGIPSGAPMTMKLHTWLSTLLAGVQRMDYPDGGGWFFPVAQSEVVTFRVNVFPKNWGRSLGPTEIKLCLQVPGDTTTYYSTGTVLDSQSWQQLSVSATAVRSGTGFLYLRLSPAYDADAELYVDFPLEISPEGMFFMDALPNRALVRVTQSTASQTADALLAKVVEGSVTMQQMFRLLNAVMAGKSSGFQANAPKFRDLADTKDRISATIDANGNRSAVSLDLT